jgi:glycosyltransferase involved in cell wall biosynthesis
MSRKPLASVITIFYNAEKFLGEAIKSVFDQTYEHWELLLVDDGSNDRSTDIGLEYARRYPEKVRYLEHAGHRNLGMSASRNLALAHAEGEYVTLLDADDVWFSQTLDERMAILASHSKAAMVYGNRQVWYSWTGNPDDVKRDHVTDLGTLPPNRLVKPPMLLVLIYGLGVTGNPGSDVMFRRDVATRVGGFEESFRGLFEDQAFLVKVLLNESVYVSDECWTKYRQHSESCVSVAIESREYSDAWKVFKKWIDEYLAQAGKERPVLNSVTSNLIQMNSTSGSPSLTLSRSISAGSRSLDLPVHQPLIARRLD